MNDQIHPESKQEAGLFSFCPTLANMLTTRSAKGKTGKDFTELGALSSANNLAVLRNLCLHLNPQRTLEIGLSFGGSCLVFTASHRDLGHAPQQQHVALDPFQSSVWDDCGLLVTQQAGLSSYLSFHSDFSAMALPSLIREGRKFDLIYIDGSHLFEDVFVDFFFVRQLLADGGVMAFDDSTDPHVAKVLRFIRRNFRTSLCQLNLDSLRADLGRTFKYKVAKFLGKTQLTAFRKIGPVARRWDAALADF